MTPLAVKTQPSSSVCTPTGSNKTWWEKQAAAVSWSPYCPVLPSGWSVYLETEVDSSGKLMVGYKGPGTSSLAVFEGALGESCSTACGSPISTTAFGDQTAMLWPAPGTTMTYDLLVDGANIDFVMVCTDIDLTTCRSIAANMHKVSRP